MRRSIPRSWPFLACAMTLCVLAVCSQYAYGGVAPQESSRIFSETNKTVRGMFLDYWETHGGLEQQGYPISEEMQEKSDTDGKTYTVQYFERARFELHPEYKPPKNVELSLLGVFQYRDAYKGVEAPNQVANIEDSIFFTQTNKTLGSIFRQYWETNGGLEQQGYPISDELTERSPLNGKEYTVQYFERAVFEKHPENAGTKFEVLLSQLGTISYFGPHPQPGVTLTPVAASPTPIPITTTAAAGTPVPTAAITSTATSSATPTSTVTLSPKPGSGTANIDWWPLLLWAAAGLVAVTVVVMLVQWVIPYSPTLVALAPFAIMVAVAGTVISYIMKLMPFPEMIPNEGGAAALFGLMVGAISWLLTGLVYSFLGLARVEGANPRSYDLLCARLIDLEGKLPILCPLGAAPPYAPGDTGVTACEEARAEVNILRNALHPNQPQSEPLPRVRNMQWVSGYGYIALWNSVHRAEEAFIEVEPREALVGYAALTRMRLVGSTIANRERLLRALRFATDTLHLPRESVTDNLPSPPPAPAGGGGAQPPVVQPVNPPTAQAQMEARATMRQVRRTVNDFRDNSWDGLIQARNYLIETITFTGLAGYLLLVLTILLGVPPESVGAAGIFYLVGAAVGLFNRQRIGSGADAHIDDYGLWHARLVHTPVFSGLAALAGVVLFAIVPAVLNAEAITPQTATPAPTFVATATQTADLRIVTSTVTVGVGATSNTTPSGTTSVTPSATATTATTAAPSAATAATASPTPGAAAAPKRLPKLEDIFSLERNLFGLIVAATFGLTPTLVVGALQKQTDKYNLDISSTETQEGGKGKS